MKKIVLILTLSFIGIGINAQMSKNMDTYTELWKSVEVQEKDDLPQSAAKEVDKILQKAINEKNTQQIIKSLIFKNKYQIVIDFESNINIFNDLESLLSQTENIADKSLLHSMIGELYLTYYQTDRWKINQRTQLIDYVPENIKEWSSNIFFEKAITHFNKSIENKAALLKETTKTYDEIIQPGEDSREFYPTLYDFLLKRNTELSSVIPLNNFERSLTAKNISIKELTGDINEFLSLNIGKPEYGNDLTTLAYYQLLLNSLTERNLTKPIVLTELERFGYLKYKSASYGDERYFESIHALYEKYKNNEISVEIIDRISDYYSNKSYIGFGYTAEEDAEKNRTLSYEWCKKGIGLFPQYKRIDILKSKIASFEEPVARIESNSIFHPEKKEKKFTITYNNLNKATVKVYSITNSIEKKKNENNSTETIKELIKEFDIELNPKTTYIPEQKEFNLDINQPGNYEIELDFDKKKMEADNNLIFHISRLQVFCRQKEKKEYEFYVVDRMNGTPIKDANIIIEKDRKPITTINTDNQGIATIKTSDNLEDYSLLEKYKYKVSFKNDKPNYENNFTFEYIFREYENKERYNVQDVVQIFTDRSIYRPGQTVFFKAIAANVGDGEYKKFIKNKKYKIELFNPNRQEVGIQTLKTNDFGSISGEFVLPQNGINGMHQLKIDNESYYISVEEYKRPTFQITFDKINKTYTFGDKVTITGRVESFSGIKLQDALVEYSVTRSSWWRWGGEPSPNIKDDSVRTKNDGSFEISFTIPESNSNNIIFWRNIYSFNITATVTDINGETQRGEYSFAVGDVSMILDTNIGEKLNKQADSKIEIKATNLDGETISTNGTYTLYRMSENDTIKQEVLKGDFATGEQKLLTERLRKTESGKYLIKLQAKDSNGKNVESENEFILYSANDKRPPIKTNDWTILKNPRFSETEDAEIILGISEKDITVLYELIRENKVFERKQIKFNNENKNFTIPYRPEYQSEVFAVFTYIIDGKIFQHNIKVTKKEKEKNLNLKFEVFRDKLRSGQHEEWRISVKDNENNPAIAELLASMYDSSIDKIRPSTLWHFRPIFRDIRYPIMFRKTGFLYGINTTYKFFIPTIENAAPFSFDELNWYGFSFTYNPKRGIRSKTSVNPPPAEIVKEYGHESLLDEVTITAALLKQQVAGLMSNEYDLSMAIGKIDAASGGGENSQPQIRQNFNETAFFYPHLRTDANGETIIGFTVPESNTTWKFRALAYDESFNTGTLEAIAISRKELMVTPNLPRFMRHGDHTSVSTKISNLSENAINGKVRIEFFDPVTEKPISLNVDNISQPFSLEKDVSGSAEWIFTVPSDIDLIGCRIIAENESFSDGEQHAISVLPNRMLVTESMPMNVNKSETKNFTFDKLINNKSESLTNYKLTLEYASNPAWYAVQALPVLSNPTNENAVNWFASYYVNTLGNAITVKYPKVTTMIDAWKKEGETKESLMSNLQKNEELKAVLLEETPWVLDAKNETEQMQRLSLLFDINNTKQKTDIALTKLAELQNSDGSWSWMKGFYPNRSVTQYILYGFSSLIPLDIQLPEKVKEMQIKALQYIDKQLLNDYQQLKKNNKNWENITYISTNQLEYLYMRSDYRDIPIAIETREAERFYTSVAEKNWTSLNLYQRSLLAVVLRKNGNKELADKIVQSLRERAIINEEMGMYWANNKSNVFLSLSAVSTHVFLMEAFKDAKAPESEMDMMKQWLLKQKQTQVWESTHASIDAIYALLSTGNDWFSESSDVTIKVGKQPIEQENKQTGTGYIKQTWVKSEIADDMGNVQISKPDNGPSYGALYWQYYEDLDKITEHKGVLNVEKMLFVENSSDKGKILSQITESNPLKVGDKVVVRLTVRVDRDMEFVHLKDMRASCFEPIETLSGNKWQNNAIYYQSTKDASTNFYFDRLPKGTYVFEYPVYVNRTGEYTNGITSIQCMYAPEFVSHTKGIKVTVK